MGAGVAASPHCPVAAGYQAWEARQSAGRFRGRVRAGGSGHDLRGPFGSLRSLPVSPRAPRQGRSPGGSPLGRSGTGVPVPAGCEAGAEARFPLPAGLPSAEASGLPWQSMDLRPGSAASQLPGRNPVLPDDSKAEALSSPVAARRLASRFLPDRRRTEVRPCLDREPEGPRPWAFHEACHSRFRSRTSPQLPHGGGFVSRPGLHSAASSPGGTRGRFAPAVAGKAFDLAIDRLGHGLEVVMECDSHQGDSDCG